MNASKTGVNRRKLRNLPGRQLLVVMYTRLSNDPKGERANHETQQREIGHMLTREGLPAPAQHFKDTDRSASKEDVHRPGWDACLEFIGNVDPEEYEVVLVGWAQDRCMRLLGDPATLANLLESKGGRLYFAKSGRVPVEKGARALLYITGALGTNESDTTSGRVLDGLETAAQNGRPHAAAPYGYKRVYTDTGKSVQVVDEDKALIVKEIATRVLEGDPLRAIARDLEDRKIPAPGNGKKRRDPITREVVGEINAPWDSRKVRQLILNKSNIGIRVHRSGGGYTEYPGAWEPILSTDVYHRVCAVLENPDRRSTTHNELSHLLSGIAKCGVCSCDMWAHPGKRKCRNGVKVPTFPVYRCDASGHVIKSEPRTDALVTDILLDLFSQANILELLGAGDEGMVREAREKEAVLQARRVELEQALSDPDAPLPAILSAIKGIDRELADVRRKAAETANAPAYLPLALAEDREAFWQSIPLARKRSILASALKVTMWPTTKRGRGAFDPTSIDVQLRTPHPEGEE